MKYIRYSFTSYAKIKNTKKKASAVNTKYGKNYSIQTEIAEKFF